MSLLDLLDIADWKSKDGEKSEKAVAKITDQNKLVRIATEAPHFMARKAAIVKLDEKKYQALFANIAKYDINWRVCLAAANKLMVQEFLADVVKKAKDNSVRRVILNKLDKQHQELFAQIAKNDGDKSVRTIATDRLSDQMLLADIAKNAKDTDIRQAAIEKMNEWHQILYIEIVRDLRANDSLREAAMKKLTNQDLILEIAKNVKYGLRHIAVEKLNELQHQTLFADIAKNDKNENVRKAAIKKLTDQTLLADLAKNDESADIRMAAIENLGEQQQELFADIAVNDKSACVRIIAIKKMNPLHQQKSLSYIAENDPEDWVRKTAAEKCSEIKTV